MKSRFVTLDGMRGAAAIAVVTWHAPTFFGGPPLPGGALAVDFFFALSGFVLAQAYEQKLKADMGWFAFMMERLKRLYPLYALGSLMGLGMFILFNVFGHQHEVSPAAYAVTIGSASLFLPAILPITPNAAFPLLMPAWSLFYELVANLAFALLATRLTNRLLGAIVAAAATALVAAGVHFGTLDIGFALSNFGGGLARVAFGFFAGVGVQRLYRTWTPRLQIPSLLVMAALMLTMVPPLGLWGQLAVVLVASPALVLAGACAEASPKLKAIYAPLGTASYALYTIHWPIVEVVRHGLSFLHLDRLTMDPVIGATLIAALVIAALLAERFYDRPVRSALKHFSERDQEAKAIRSEVDAPQPASGL